MSEATDEELEEYQALADIECEFGLEHYDQDDYVGGIIGEVYKNRKRIQRLEGAIRFIKDYQTPIGSSFTDWYNTVMGKCYEVLKEARG